MLDNEYYRIYNPNTKTYGEKYTWNQLLYSWYSELRVQQSHYSWKTRKYTYTYSDPFSHYAVRSLFARFGHTDNDGWWEAPTPEGHWITEYRWIEEFDLDDILKSKEVLKPFKKFIRYPRVWKYSLRVIDSYGRTLSNGYLKAAYKLYKPDASHEKDKISTYNLSRWGRLYAMREITFKGYKYREGNVPGVHRRKWRKRRYCNDHGHVCGEKRRWYGDVVDSKECGYEFGVTYKIREKRNPHGLPWGLKHSRRAYRDYNWKSQGKKEKQWM